MSEKLVSIAEVINIEHSSESWYKFDGFKITTTEHTYFLLITNDQCCCESWGYFTSNDDANSFIGKVLVSVEATYKCLNHQKLEDSGYYDDYGGIQFVDFKFSDGSVLQFAVYNGHNGYYGHPILFTKDNDVIISQYI